jgi:hypothetical protein
MDPFFVILAAYALAVTFGDRKREPRRSSQLHELEMAET